MAVKFGTDINLTGCEMQNAKLHMTNPSQFSSFSVESLRGRIIFDNQDTELDRVKVFQKTGTDATTAAATGAWRWLLDSRMLDSSNKILTSYLPDIIFGQMICGGNTSGVPNSDNQIKAYITSRLKAKLIAEGGSVLGTEGEGYYIFLLTTTTGASAQGKYGYGQLENVYFLTGDDINTAWGGVADFHVGDWLVSLGTKWSKVDNTDAVTGVKGDADDSFSIGNVNLKLENIIGVTPATKLLGITSGINEVTESGNTYYKLDPSYVILDSTHRFTTDAEKAVWNTLPTVEQTLSNAVSANASRIDSVEYLATCLNEEVLGIGKRTSLLESYFTDGSANTAVKLLTARSIWGQSFDGTANVTGAMSGVTSIDSLLLFNTNNTITFSCDVLPSETDTKYIGSSLLRWNAYLNALDAVTGSFSSTLSVTGQATVGSLVSNGGITAYASNAQVSGTILDQIPIDTDVFDISTGVLKTKSGGVGTITSVTAGTGLTGGGSSGAVTLALSTATQTAIAKAHDHSNNKSILDSITAAFTSEEKIKLNSVAADAQVNVLESVKLNGTALTITSKAVNVNACTSITTPTGITAEPLTSGGEIVLKFTNGYSIPTTDSQTAWNSKAKSYSIAVEGNGSTSYEYNNPALTEQVAVTLYDSSNDIVFTDINVTASKIKVTFANAQSTNTEYRLVVIG